jgi:hypothetical protein
MYRSYSPSSSSVGAYPLAAVYGPGVAVIGADGRASASLDRSSAERSGRADWATDGSEAVKSTVEAGTMVGKAGRPVCLSLLSVKDVART